MNANPLIAVASRLGTRLSGASRPLGHFALVVVLLLGSASLVAAKEKDAAKGGGGSDSGIRGVYAMSMSPSDRGLHVVEYWSAKGAFRAHVTVSGHPLITIVNGDFYYTLDPVHKRGVGIRRNPRAIEKSKLRERSFANEFFDIVAAGGEKIRTEDTPTGPVDVYRNTDEDGRRTVWVTADEHQLPLRYEAFNRATGSTARLDYANWAPLRLTEAFFEPPSEGGGWDIEIVDSYEAWLKADRSKGFLRAPTIFPALLHGPR